MYSTATMSEIERINLTMQIAIKEAAQRHAAKQGRTLSGQIEHILATYLMGVGELTAMPIREERRGGKRSGAGKKKTTDVPEVSE